MIDSDLSDDESALRWLISLAKPGFWVQLARAMRLIQEHTGFGFIGIQIADGLLGTRYLKAEVSIEKTKG